MRTGTMTSHPDTLDLNSGIDAANLYSGIKMFHWQWAFTELAVPSARSLCWSPAHLTLPAPLPLPLPFQLLITGATCVRPPLPLPILLVGRTDTVDERVVSRQSGRSRFVPFLQCSAHWDTGIRAFSAVPRALRYWYSTPPLAAAYRCYAAALDRCGTSQISSGRFRWLALVSVAACALTFVFSVNRLVTHGRVAQAAAYVRPACREYSLHRLFHTPHTNRPNRRQTIGRPHKPKM